MERFIVAILLFSASCGDNSSSSEQGLSRTFDILYEIHDHNEVDNCDISRTCSQSNADIYCTELGYAYATSFECEGFNCRTNDNRYKSGSWMTQVTCYKR